MLPPKTDFLRLSTRELLARRRRLARSLVALDRVLLGSLVAQTRRCGKAGCRCTSGSGHGPYTYFTPRRAYFTPRRGGRGMRYVPVAQVAPASDYLRHGALVEAVLAEISAINVELLARRALS